LRALYEAHALGGLSIKPYWVLTMESAEHDWVAPEAVDATELEVSPRTRAGGAQTAEADGDGWEHDLSTYGDRVLQGLSWIAYALDLAGSSRLP
jgi:hypothetical protein